MIYDAVHLFAQALHNLTKAQNIEPEQLTCGEMKTWSQGPSLINYMKMVRPAPPAIHRQCRIDVVGGLWQTNDEEIFLYLNNSINFFHQLSRRGTNCTF